METKEINKENERLENKMYMNKSEFMKYTGLTRTAVDLLVDMKDFPCTKINNIYAINKNEALKYLGRNRMIII